MKRGDVIIAINGKSVEDAGSLRFRLATLDVGATATLSVLRKRQALEIPVRLIAAPETPPAQKTELSGAQPLAGATVANLSPALAEQLQLRANGRAWSSSRSAAATTAMRLGLKPGDIVLAVNGRKVAKVEDLQNALANANGSWDITFRRDGETRTLRIE